MTTTWSQQAIDLLKSTGRCTVESSLLSEINEIQNVQTQSGQSKTAQTRSEQTEKQAEKIDG